MPGPFPNIPDEGVRRSLELLWDRIAELEAAIAGGGASGPAGGDLTGTFPNPQIAAGAIVDADIALAAAIAQTKINGLVGALAALQPLDSDLTAIAGLAPANDDIIQRKAGAWTNRTLAQYRTDLYLATLLGPNGTAALPTFSFSADPDTGMFRSAANSLAFSAGGTTRMFITGSLFVVSVAARFDSAIAFAAEEITTATKTLTQSTSKRYQILNYSAGATQDTTLPNLVAGNWAEYCFIDRLDYSLAGATTWTIHAPDPLGPGGGGTYATLNGVRGGTQVVGLNEEWEVKVVGTAVDDGSGDTVGVAYEATQKR